MSCYSLGISTFYHDSAACLLENGKIVGRVKDTMVSGNTYQLLKKVTAIGRDPKWVGGSLNLPPLCFSKVSVASK